MVGIIKSVLKIKEMIIDFAYESSELQRQLDNICRTECRGSCDIETCIVSNLLYLISSVKHDMEVLFNELDFFQKGFLVVKENEKN